MCKKYSPTNAVHAIFKHYVILGGLPAIGKNGGKMYVEDQNGCAVTVLATPEMRKMLALTDHKSSPACKLSNIDIDIDSLISRPRNWHKKGLLVIDFIQSLQNAHDTAADYYQSSINNGMNQGMAHDIFCARLVNELFNVCNGFKMTNLALDIKMRDRPHRYSQTDEQLISSAPKFSNKGELVTV